MKKFYLPIALVVLLIGSFVVWVIVERLPDWMGTTRNQHSFIDQLEEKGAIDFKTKTIGGEEIRIQQFEGKIVILSFWASWCGPCIEEFPSMVSLLKKFPDQVVMLAVSSDYTKEDIDTFLKDIGVTSKLSNLFVVWDPEHSISQHYQVQRLPESFVFGKNLKLLRKVIGSIKWDDADATTFFETHVKQ